MKIDSVENIIKGSPNRMRESVFIKEDLGLYSEIVEYTGHLDLSFKQRVWHWINNINDYVVCIECGMNRVNFNMKWRDGYKKFCSSKCSSNNKELQSDIKERMIEKYGVDHYSKTGEYVEKVKKTSLERYGVDNYAKTNDFIERSKETFRERYGVDSYTKTLEYKEKSKKTYMEKYGVDHYVKTDEYKERYKNICVDKLGVDHIYKSPLYRSKFSISKHVDYLGYLDGYNIFKCERGCEYKITTDIYYGRIRNNIPLCTICNPVSEQRSIKEKDFLFVLGEMYKGEIIESYRDTYEIDVYLPELNLGFEFNGLYWHSDKFKDKFYHIDKTNFFNERGIRIIHIWEDDWVFRRDIILSQIRNLIGENTKIWARKCDVRLVDRGSGLEFLNNNHIQGQDRSIIKIGLYHNDELVSIMTFNKSEGRKKMGNDEWNLSRFCNVIGCNVVGGASKLLHYFIRECKPKRIISYADKDWSVGGLYKTIGFQLIGDTKPDYKYVVGDVRVHKQNFTKKRLGIDTITESEWMSGKNINRIWDCGKLKFEMLLNEKD